ncbi:MULTISPECIES: tetratricopeptide repeat protein [unclassified Paenibacillus]|uniref:tetratricopeptide repeat protein n=1 Tax=unclassified Paenibacillus TaxID=185978 RepID=UPI0009A5873A|nr:MULTISPECIES: tetratricopeptide repeat protein [unclassified Paenibacillus]SLK17358.1 hypothetical protein SAMN06272722_11176 [Paenibacillus sp. RU5A]SOC74728.1 hypothetical protein SAMN05880581_11176 [Paenibacillus sp. RU26A]SOC76864.1 hypothetical protein SAMN05880586_11176 [Paenibacillus sp. RU5M]
MAFKSELKIEANRLRKAGEIRDALHIYRTLWSKNNDKFDGAGLLHCLRKLKSFDEALPLADELLLKYKDFNWCRIEITWTYIEGKLEQFKDKEPLENVLEVANEILSLQPEDFALNKVVFSVLKSAKGSNKWDIVNDWVTKIDPSTLSKEPILESKREGWSYYTLWYNYKINALIKLGLYSPAIELLNILLPEIPRGQQKFFRRLAALSFYLLGEYDKAEERYKKLCSHPNPDWWLLHEYAKVLRDKGEPSKAINLMYKAAANNSRLESMVTLFLDISILCKENNNLEISRNHLYLTLYVREKYEWKIAEDLLSRINNINNQIGNNSKPNSLSEALKLCRDVWKTAHGIEETKTLTPAIKNKRTNLSGRVKINHNDKPFCFIFLTNNESIFCYKSDLPTNIKDNDIVIFDSIPSFDKKKNAESWKATNVRLQ